MIHSERSLSLYEIGLGLRKTNRTVLNSCSLLIHLCPPIYDSCVPPKWELSTQCQLCPPNDSCVYPMTAVSTQYDSCIHQWQLCPPNMTAVSTNDRLRPPMTAVSTQWQQLWKVFATFVFLFLFDSLHCEVLPFLPVNLTSEGEGGNQLQHNLPPFLQMLHVRRRDNGLLNWLLATCSSISQVSAVNCHFTSSGLHDMAFALISLVRPRTYPLELVMIPPSYDHGLTPCN